MRDIYIRILVCFFLFLGACKQKDNRLSEQGLEVDFKLYAEDNLSELLEADFIKLETNESCFINKGITQLEFAAGKIFILSGGAESNLFVFDRPGKFIKSIGNRGSGPGEFVIPVSFSINMQSKIISLVDIAQQKILDYSLDNFQYISERKLGFYSSNFEYIDSKTLLLKNSDAQSGNKEWEFLLADSSLNIKGKLMKRDFITGYNTGRTKSLYKNDGEVYAYAQYSPLVYNFREDKMEPAYSLRFANFNLPPRDFLNQISANNQNFLAKLDVSDYIYYYCVLEAGGTLNAYFSVSQEAYLGLYDKKNASGFCIPRSDFEKGMKIGKMERPSGTVNDYIVAALQPSELLEELSEKYVFDDRLAKILKTSKEDDNPILFLYRFKG